MKKYIVWGKVSGEPTPQVPPRSQQDRTNYYLSILKPIWNFWFNEHEEEGLTRNKENSQLEREMRRFREVQYDKGKRGEFQE